MTRRGHGLHRIVGEGSPCGLCWSPGGATGAISRGLKAAGYEPAVKSARFVVTGTYGPLRQGERVDETTVHSALSGCAGRVAKLFDHVRDGQVDDFETP